MGVISLSFRREAIVQGWRSLGVILRIMPITLTKEILPVNDSWSFILLVLFPSHLPVDENFLLCPWIWTCPWSSLCDCLHYGFQTFLSSHHICVSQFLVKSILITTSPVGYTSLIEPGLIHFLLGLWWLNELIYRNMLEKSPTHGTPTKFYVSVSWCYYCYYYPSYRLLRFLCFVVCTSRLWLPWTCILHYVICSFSEGCSDCL